MHMSMPKKQNKQKESVMLTYAELVAKIQTILPEASFGEDLEGQIIIHTNLTQPNKDDNAQLATLESDEWCHQSCGAV
jgi:hypothetical protein